MEQLLLQNCPLQHVISWFNSMICKIAPTCLKFAKARYHFRKHPVLCLKSPESRAFDWNIIVMSACIWIMHSVNYNESHSHCQWQQSVIVLLITAAASSVFYLTAPPVSLMKSLTLSYAFSLPEKTKAKHFLINVMNNTLQDDSWLLFVMEFLSQVLFS